MTCYHPNFVIKFLKGDGGVKFVGSLENNLLYQFLDFTKPYYSGKIDSHTDFLDYKLFSSEQLSTSFCQFIQVPCGQCVGCRLDYSRQWAVRCVHESQLHQQNCFITLTYSPEYAEKNLRMVNTETGEISQNYSLKKKDLQDFWKRLRKAIAPVKIRYYACGEYGDENNRPHYHAIIFGYDFSADRYRIYPPKKKFQKNVFPTWRSNLLEKCWTFGISQINEVNFDTCAYVARYIMKKQKGKNAAEFYDEKGINPEFVVMSRKPGIAADWLSENYKSVYPSDDIVVLRKDGVRHCKPPRYYDNLYDVLYPSDMEKIRQKRKLKAEKYEKYDPERFAAKEKVKMAQISQLKRSV